MDPKDYIPIVISSFSLIISATVAIKTYKLEKEREKRLKTNLKVELKRSIIAKDKESKFYIFEIMAKNNSDINNSVKGLSLNINYHKEKNYYDKKTYTLNYNSELDKKLKKSLPVCVSERNSVKLFGVFKLAKNFNEINEIDDYQIIVFDTFDNQYKISTTMIKNTVEVDKLEDF